MKERIEMSEIRARSGWNGEILPESLQKRWAVEQAAEEREAARVEREREQIREYRRQANIQASIALAQARGEEIPDMRLALQHGVGRTKAEALSYMSALGDVEDMREEAARQKRFREFELQESADLSADTSAPAPEADVSQLVASRDGKIRPKLDERQARHDNLVEARYQASVERRTPARFRRVER